MKYLNAQTLANSTSPSAIVSKKCRVLSSRPTLMKVSIGGTLDVTSEPSLSSAVAGTIAEVELLRFLLLPTSKSPSTFCAMKRLSSILLPRSSILSSLLL